MERQTVTSSYNCGHIDIKTTYSQNGRQKNMQEFKHAESQADTDSSSNYKCGEIDIKIDRQTDSYLQL